MSNPWARTEPAEKITPPDHLRPPEPVISLEYQPESAARDSGGHHLTLNLVGAKTRSAPMKDPLASKLPGGGWTEVDPSEVGNVCLRIYLPHYHTKSIEISCQVITNLQGLTQQRDLTTGEYQLLQSSWPKLRQDILDCAYQRMTRSAFEAYEMSVERADHVLADPDPKVTVSQLNNTIVEGWAEEAVVSGTVASTDPYARGNYDPAALAAQSATEEPVHAVVISFQESNWGDDGGEHCPRLLMVTPTQLEWLQRYDPIPDSEDEMLVSLQNAPEGTLPANVVLVQTVWHTYD